MGEQHGGCSLGIYSCSIECHKRFKGPRRRTGSDINFETGVKLLDDGNAPCLKATVRSNGAIDFTSTMNTMVQSNDENAIDVLFVRRVPEPITGSNLYSALDVQTLHGSPFRRIIQHFEGSLRALHC